MIEKVAIVRALRSAMTEEFGNTYIADELGMEESDLSAEVADVPENATEPAPEPTPAPKAAPAPAPKKTVKKAEPVEAEFMEVDESTGEVIEEEDDFEDLQAAFFK